MGTIRDCRESQTYELSLAGIESNPTGLSICFAVGELFWEHRGIGERKVRLMSTVYAASPERLIYLVLDGWAQTFQRRGPTDPLLGFMGVATPMTFTLPPLTFKLWALTLPTWLHMYEYLVNSTESTFDKESMKAFKSLKAYKYFSDGLYSEQRLRTSSGRSSHRERTLSILFEQKAKTTCTVYVVI